VARLTKTKRDKLPKSIFAGPNRSYPIPDRGHAIAAKAFAGRAKNAGRMGEAMYDRIVARANVKLKRNK
jgi:hypothetical protein